MFALLLTTQLKHKGAEGGGPCACAAGRLGGGKSTCCSDRCNSACAPGFPFSACASAPAAAHGPGRADGWGSRPGLLPYTAFGDPWRSSSQPSTSAHVSGVRTCARRHASRVRSPVQPAWWRREVSVRCGPDAGVAGREDYRAPRSKSCTLQRPAGWAGAAFRALIAALRPHKLAR
eukprot:Tamp_15189.p2 GENE.Tamp_15189~~Tamp_15189.p2  ORF type:complete len:176 (-),score=10.08 Tamp_15189:1032-1559(-)